MELDHFSHDHPLIPREGHKDEGGEVSCYGCVRPISGPSYGCTRCQYFLHKSCAELPRKMTHPCHPEHTLTLLSTPSGDYGNFCDVCGETCKRFIYRCSPCNFDVDINCASMAHGIQRRIEHKSHKHQLTPLQKPAMFLCDACGKEHKGTSYLCVTCGFWANQKCASLRETIVIRQHDHPLTLIHSFPTEYFRLGLRCRICKDTVYKSSWLYYCSECSYSVHLNCATSESGNSETATELLDLDLNLMELNSVTSGMATTNTRPSKPEIKAKDLDPNPITLPVPDDSIDMTTIFIKDIRLQQHKYNREATSVISHVSQDHSLIFFDKKIDDEPCSGSKLPLSNDVIIKVNEKCNGCAQTISTAPFYSCAECKSSLHQWCAELPNELRHPCHPEHPLLLITQRCKSFHLHRCRCCRLFCNGFIFHCSACKFYLDSKCASLPRIIRHEAHKHTLALRQLGSDSCSACDDNIYRFAFVCDPCNLNLCIRCVLLPRTVRHRYDEHPFTLTYPHVKGQAHADEYYCEICEEEIESKYWFYHCINCDQSLHSKCILPPIGPLSNIKFGVTLKSVDHPHDLTFVQQCKPKHNSTCGKCGVPSEAENKNKDAAFECDSCNFWIHFECTSLAEEIHREID